MDPFLQQIGERPVHRALAGDPAEPLKTDRDDFHRKMAFTARVVAGVAGVLGAVVRDDEADGREVFTQATFDFRFHFTHRSLPFCDPHPYMAAFGESGAGMKAKGGAFPGERACAHPGCPEAGDYRAPLNRPGSAFAGPSGPPEWQYFCLEHVRAFNAGWNYFDGMSEDAIWEAQTPYPSWDRETRAFAHNAMAGEARVEDTLGVLRWKTASARAEPESRLSREDRQALAKLGLPDTASLAEVKAKYRQLARRYHPDANDGSREHEARFQALTEAYTKLENSAAFGRKR